jgi:hypothetical protein
VGRKIEIHSPYRTGNEFRKTKIAKLRNRELFVQGSFVETIKCIKMANPYAKINPSINSEPKMSGKPTTFISTGEYGTSTALQTINHGHTEI